MLSRQYPGIRDAAPPEPAAVYRQAFLCATGHLGISSSDAAALVETLTDCEFEKCGWAELEPAVQALQTVVEDILAAMIIRRNPCD